MLVAIGGSLLLSAALVPIIGSSLFPKADTPQFLVNIEAPNGTSLAETDAALRFVEDKLANMPEVKSWFANLGHGNPQIYYNHIVRKDASNYGEIFVQLKEYDTRDTPRVLDELRAQLGRYPGRAHLREGVRERPADQRADRGARDRPRSRRDREALARRWRRSSRARRARATCRTR